MSKNWFFTGIKKGLCTFSENMKKCNCKALLKENCKKSLKIILKKTIVIEKYKKHLKEMQFATFPGFCRTHVVGND